MAKEDIRRYCLDQLRSMRDRGETLTSPDAPEIELDEDFWRNARVVIPEEKGKIPVSIRGDTEC